MRTRVVSSRVSLEVALDATTTMAQLLALLPRPENAWGVRMLSYGPWQLGEGDTMQERPRGKGTRWTIEKLLGK